MTELRIAMAQISSQRGNIEKNISRHIEVIDLAGRLNISLLVFPELSLTGYEPELAATLATTLEDTRLQELSTAAIQNNIWAVVGAPLINKSHIEIGAIVFCPEGEISTYSKMYLHPGEGEYFKASSIPKIIEIQNQKIGLAICADTNNEDHAKYYANQGVVAYVAGVLISFGGYASDTEKLKECAVQHNMLVAIANHSRPTGDWSPVGKSASWSNKGLLSMASEDIDCLVVSRKTEDAWDAETISI